MKPVSYVQSGLTAEVQIRRRPAALHGSVVIDAGPDLPARFLIPVLSRMETRAWLAFEQATDASRKYYVDDIELEGTLSTHWNGTCSHHSATEALAHSLEWLEELAQECGVILV